MEQRAYAQIVNDVLDAIDFILTDSRKAILTHDKAFLKRAADRRAEVTKSNRPAVEALIASKEKSETAKKFLAILPSVQKVGIALEALLEAVRKKIDGDVVFTEKGLVEIRTVSAMIGELAKNTKDAVTTGNDLLKRQNRAQMEEIINAADQFAMAHSERLIEGLCSPKASYIYLDMMDSLKTTARELATMSEKT